VVVTDPARGVENLRPIVSSGQFNNRMGLLEELEAGFHGRYDSPLGQAHRTTYQRAVNLMMDRGARAFDISQEPSAAQSAYGSGRFGQGCLLARRLIEAGVTFVPGGPGGSDT